MPLHSLTLQHFRNHKNKSFSFSDSLSVVLGKNTAGKTNLLEAIFLLSSGKSFKGRDEDMLCFAEEFARVKSGDLEVILSQSQDRLLRKFLIAGVSKRRADFVGNLPTVLFTPLDLEIIVGGPSMRRRYFDFVLEQVDSDYRYALSTYERGIRHRNKLLEEAKKWGRRNEDQFSYWDKLLIDSGAVLSKKRQEYITFINAFHKNIFQFSVEYDKSVISQERLEQYRKAEVEAAVTLVGPHRDDILFFMPHADLREMKTFGSRGQQRLSVLQLKLIELSFVKEVLQESPLLLLDDIFSELDQGHINLILSMIQNQQTILTTTHREFIPKDFYSSVAVIELEK